MRITADTNFFVSATQWDNSVAHKLLIKLIKTNAEITERLIYRLI